MESELIYAVTGIALTAVGLYALIVRRHMIRRLLAVNIMGAGVFTLFVSLATDVSNGVDPVPQAMVLTGIVVAVSATALGLVLIRRIYAATGSTRLAEESSILDTLEGEE